VTDQVGRGIAQRGREDRYADATGRIDSIGKSLDVRGVPGRVLRSVEEDATRGESGRTHHLLGNCRHVRLRGVKSARPTVVRTLPVSVSFRGLPTVRRWGLWEGRGCHPAELFGRRFSRCRSDRVGEESRAAEGSLDRPGRGSGAPGCDSGRHSRVRHQRGVGSCSPPSTTEAGSGHASSSSSFAYAWAGREPRRP
jgi:hypothetical protein